ncbi:MAG: DUF6597 domain-containing transcriptional factor [Flavobacteriaceae bacterium]
MVKNKSYKPVTFLSRYIDRFYTYERSSNDYFQVPAVLPGTGLELIFHTDRPLSIQTKKLPQAHTVCPRKMFRFDDAKKISFISVRFKSGAFRHFSPIPFSALNDCYYSVPDLWGQNGKKVLDKLENIMETEGKIKEIELFLGDIFSDFHNGEK